VTPAVTSAGVTITANERPLWNPESSGLIVYTSDATFWNVPLQGAATRIASLHTASDTGTQVQYVLTGPMGGHVWSPDHGASFAIVACDSSHMTSGIYRITRRTGHVTPSITGERDIGGELPGQTAAVDNQATFVSLVGSAAALPELWAVHGSSSAESRLTRLNPEVDSVTPGRRLLVHWTSKSGAAMQGLLLLPSNYTPGRRVPLIVFPYQRAMRYANVFGFWNGYFNMQLYATRGYAVLYPDLTWRRSAPMQGLADDVLPGIDSVVAMGVADSAHVGVLGHSSGGYDVLALITGTTRFAAAVESAGPSSMFQEWGLLDGEGQVWVERQMGLGGDPWHYRERYIQNSPWFSLSRLTTPLLVLDGEQDAQATSSDAVFVALRALGKPVEYAKYGGEGHSPLYWILPNQRDAFERSLHWFERYLKPVSLPH
jgi:dipeptidyl aminopeptidase/acylaminoacyl peptidase